MGRRWTKVQIYDVLHKVTVTSLMGLTVGGCGILSYVIYFHYSVVKPVIKEKQKVMAENKLSAEQFDVERELKQKQRDAETLVS